MNATLDRSKALLVVMAGGFCLLACGSTPPTVTRDAGPLGATFDGGLLDGGVFSPDGGNDGGTIVSVDGGVANQSPSCICDPVNAFLGRGESATLTAGCSDPERQALSYSWSIISGPSGATDSIAHPGAPSISFTPSQYTLETTPYIVRATATDALGATASCQSSFIVGERARGFLARLAWWNNTAGDVALHLLDVGVSAEPWASNGWFNTPNDCWYANLSPDWGAYGNTLDNPRLRELPRANTLLTLEWPQDGRYRVGVQAHCATAGTMVRLQILCNGILKGEFVRSMADPDFWDVGTLEWPSCNLASVDETRRVVTCQ